MRRYFHTTPKLSNSASPGSLDTCGTNDLVLPLAEARAGDVAVFARAVVADHGPDADY